jgi:nicotinamide riboside kinase
MERGRAMRQMRAWVLGALFLAMAGGVYAGSEKVKLVYKATAGSVGRYKTDATIVIEAGGMKLNLEQKETEKVTFTAVSPTGDITVERESESREMTLNGMKLPPDEGPKTKTTVVTRANGSLVSFASTDDDKENLQLNVRLFPTSNVVFPDKELGVGDKWSHDFKGDTSTGARDGKADYEVVAFEKVKDVDGVRLKLAYKENEGSPALSSTGTLVVEKASGDALTGDFTVENVPFPGPGGMAFTAQAKIRQERVSGGPMGGKVEPAKEKTIDEVVKDYDKLPGLITLFRKKEAGKETVYAEIREDQLDQLFFIQATASTGNAETVIPGDPLADVAFKFSRLPDDRLVIVVPNINFLAAEGAPIKKAVKRAFPDAMLDVFKVEAKQPDRKSLLINIGGFFTSDFAQIGRMLSGGGGPLAGLTGGGGPGYSLDRDKTFVTAWKAFPDNVVVETAYHFQRAGGGGGGGVFGGALTVADPRSLPLRVNFNLWSLAKDDYVPRLADPRVGYFYTEYQDFTDDGKDTQLVRYILRWDVEKADPTAAVSPPKKPIVFWMDNAIPTEYREAVRDGILMWNRAFLKIGIKDAVEVRQMPDDADWDHADMRYNVIRWSTTVDAPYGAIALFRVNPITGQIVNAGITVDAILTRGGKLEKRRLIDPATHFDPAPTPQPDRYGRCRCGYQQAASDQAWFGLTALEMLAAAGEKVDEKKYTDEFLRSIVAHEMGHILGLFHNFAASTQFSLAELKDPAKIKQHGVIGSVMDYVPFNISALKKPGVDYWTPVIGRYDEWAVEYGYSDLGATKPEDEVSRLRTIAAKGNSPGHQYQNDFFADQFDPAISRFDLGSEPLDYHARQMQVARHLLMTLDRTEPKPGRSYWDFTRAFNGLMNVYASSASAASRYVGGLHLRRNFKGDPGEKPVLVPVDGARQQRALRLMNDYLFSETALNFPKHYYTRMTGDPFPSFSGLVASPDFPIRDQLANLQRAALRRTFASSTLGRIANTEFKAADPRQVLTLTQLFDSVGANVWSEVAGKRNIPTLRRQLQRSHLDLMTGMVLGTTPAPEDARMLAWNQLRNLRTRIQATRGAKVDTYTRVHLDETLMRINRALNAMQTLGGQSSPGPSLLQLLLGNENKPKE